MTIMEKIDELACRGNKKSWCDNCKKLYQEIKKELGE